jgi:hypothetical protein
MRAHHFTPEVSLQTAFPTIYPGITLSASVAGAVFAGSATNAQLLDNLGQSAVHAQRHCQHCHHWCIACAKQHRFVCGAANVFNVNTTTTDANVKSDISGGNLIIQANVGGVTYNVATALGASGIICHKQCCHSGHHTDCDWQQFRRQFEHMAGQVSAIGNITGGNINTLGLGTRGINQCHSQCARLAIYALPVN